MGIMFKISVPIDNLQFGEIVKTNLENAELVRKAKNYECEANRTSRED